MIKNGDKQRILITQPRPETDKSPYFELAKKYDVELAFHPFIRLEPIPAKDFRKQKVDIAQYTAVIFTSRNAIDHFFRICEEMKVIVSQDTKYFLSRKRWPSISRSSSSIANGRFSMAPTD